ERLGFRCSGELHEVPLAAIISMLSPVRQVALARLGTTRSAARTPRPDHGRRERDAVRVAVATMVVLGGSSG
ncbi:MAG: hypothetical protein ACXWZG_02295, partial [Microbacterium sp.]